MQLLNGEVLVGSHNLSETRSFHSGKMSVDERGIDPNVTRIAPEHGCHGRQTAIIIVMNIILN